MPSSSDAIALPLLAGQASMWVAEQMGTIGRPYNLRTLVSRPRRDGLNETTAVLACRTMVERHPSISARLPSERGVPTQVFDRPAPVESRVAAVDDPTGEVALLSLTAELGAVAIDIEDGPLTRFYVLAAKEFIHIAVLQHHCITDGIAQDQISRDLGALLEGNPLDTLDDFFEISSRALELQRQGEWDIAGLVEGHAEPLPDELSFPSEERTGEGAIQRLYLDGLADRLSVVAAERGVTRLGLVTAGLGVAFGPHVSDDWLLGIVATTRPGPAVRVTGCFVNTVPLVVRASWAAMSPAVLVEVTGAVREQLSHRHVPVAAWAREWRRRGLQYPTPERVTLSLFPSTRDRLPSTGIVKGMRDGISISAGFGHELSLTLEHPHHLMTDDVATDILNRLGTALAELT